MEPLDALTRAVAQYRQRLVDIGADQWREPSVCSGWSVKDVADHVLGGNRFAVALVGGASSDDAFDRRDSRRASTATHRRFAESAECATRRTFKRPGGLEAIVRHPQGDIRGRTFLITVYGDLLAARLGSRSLDGR